MSKRAIKTAVVLWFGALLLGMWAVKANAAPTDVALTWVPGLTYESGGNFDESQITNYTLYCDGSSQGTFANDYTRRYVVNTALLGAGDHTCGVSETVAGIESVMSNTVSFTLGQPTPTAPTLTVE